MSRGQGNDLPRQPAASPRSTEYKIGERLQRIAIDRRALVHALSTFQDEQDFLTVWQSQDPASVNKMDAVERPAERIATLLQEIHDLLEKEAERHTEDVTFKDDMGRWRKLAVRKHISHATADRMTAVSRLRDDLQHLYPEMKKLTGADVYQVVNDLPHLLGTVVKGLNEWQKAMDTRPSAS